jgi:hypothetical protein
MINNFSLPLAGQSFWQDFIDRGKLANEAVKNITLHRGLDSLPSSP